MDCIIKGVYDNWLQYYTYTQLQRMLSIYGFNYAMHWLSYIFFRPYIFPFSGFLFRCPRNFHFSSSQRKCLQLTKQVPCHKFSDSASGTFVYPVIELEKESLSQFDQASAYWDYMQFLPQENQRIIQVLPPAELPRNWIWCYICRKLFLTASFNW